MSALQARQAVRQGCFMPSALAPSQCSSRVCQQQRRHHPQQAQQRLFHQQQQQHSRAANLQLARAEPPTSSGAAAGSTPPLNSSSVIGDSDLSFLLKLLGFSFAGAAIIKYGSLAISLPFEPNAAVAAGIVLGTPALYSLYLLTQGSKQ